LLRVEAKPLLTGLPPLVDDCSKLLILGSFPSEMSLVKQEYYGNPQNHFWPVMEALFGVQPASSYGERTSALVEQGAAVWDVIARCSREGSGDDKIKHAIANPIIALLKDHPAIRRVFFNGGMAYRTARLLTPGVFGLPWVECEQMPSTSPRNARMPLAAKVEAWRRIRDWLKDSS
jgi:TDG/mug DNA glycosylase family protein